MNIRKTLTNVVGSAAFAVTSLYAGHVLADAEPDQAAQEETVQDGKSTAETGTFVPDQAGTATPDQTYQCSEADADAANADANAEADAAEPAELKAEEPAAATPDPVEASAAATPALAPVAPAAETETKATGELCAGYSIKGLDKAFNYKCVDKNRAQGCGTGVGDNSVAGKEYSVFPIKGHPKLEEVCGGKKVTDVAGKGLAEEEKKPEAGDDSTATAAPTSAGPYVSTTPKKEQDRWSASVFAGVAGGNRASEVNVYDGVAFRRDLDEITAGLSLEVRGGHYWTDNKNRGSEQADPRIQNKLLDDGTTYKKTVETETEYSAMDNHGGFAGLRLNYEVLDWLEVFAGLDLRMREENETTNYQKTVSLERNMNTLGDPKTINQRESSTEVEVGAYPNTGLKLFTPDDMLGPINLFGSLTAGYDQLNKSGQWGLELGAELNF